MIFDRTQYDIDTAIALRNKLGSGGELTDSEIAQIERGTLTINTLNRIEEKQSELKNLFEADAYFVGDITNRVWTYTDYFLQSDFDRILDNLDKLRKAYFVYKSTPNVSNKNFTQYKTINEVEHILNDLDLMISDVKSHYRECGDVICGEE